MEVPVSSRDETTADPQYIHEVFTRSVGRPSGTSMSFLSSSIPRPVSYSLVVEEEVEEGEFGRSIHDRPNSTDGGTVFTVLPSVAMTDPPPLIHGRYHLGGHVLTPKGVVGVGPVMGKGHYRRLLISNFIRNNMRPVSPLL